VLIISASRGIGAQNALQYARAPVVPRFHWWLAPDLPLDASKDAILRKHPAAKVLTFPTDVRDVKRAEEVVAATVTVANFGRLDILVANACFVLQSLSPSVSIIVSSSVRVEYQVLIAFCRISRHQGLSCAPRFCQDGHV
jgi:NAD(P)-dependent dehydrogenase (short-subunit alcohol dehydrogenase family)